ncbi:Tryptophan--tRNA ligase [compost metagenome]
MQEIEARYEGQGYGPFKKELAEQVVSVIEPLQAKYNDIRNSGEIHQILKEGAERAAEVADRTLADVKEKMGFLPTFQ